MQFFNDLWIFDLTSSQFFPTTCSSKPSPRGRLLIQSKTFLAHLQSKRKKGLAGTESRPSTNLPAPERATFASPTKTVSYSLAERTASSTTTTRGRTTLPVESGPNSNASVSYLSLGKGTQRPLWATSCTSLEGGTSTVRIWVIWLRSRSRPRGGSCSRTWDPRLGRGADTRWPASTRRCSCSAESPSRDSLTTRV